jgi:hypothetical protein
VAFRAKGGTFSREAISRLRKEDAGNGTVMSGGDVWLATAFIREWSNVLMGQQQQSSGTKSWRRALSQAISTLIEEMPSLTSGASSSQQFLNKLPRVMPISAQAGSKRMRSSGKSSQSNGQRKRSYTLRVKGPSQNMESAIHNLQTQGFTVESVEKNS